MFCSKCGAENADDSGFCKQCGAQTGSSGAVTTGSSTSLEPNVAGLLCYVLSWITGLIFILIEKENEFVRFHAMQSIVVFGGITIIQILLAILGIIPAIGILFTILGWIVWLGSVVLWVLLMVKAYQGERYKLPIAGNFAEKYL
jgi:uncharacterized membrane protein